MWWNKCYLKWAVMGRAYARKLCFSCENPFCSFYFLPFPLGTSKNTKANGLANPVCVQQKPLVTSWELCLLLMPEVFSWDYFFPFPGYNEFTFLTSIPKLLMSLAAWRSLQPQLILIFVRKNFYKQTSIEVKVHWVKAFFPGHKGHRPWQLSVWS